MPLLNLLRNRRPLRGMVVGAALIGGLSGPVGSAGAGVPAALPAAKASASFVPSGSGLPSQPLTDALGIHTGAPIGPLGAARKARRADTSTCSTRTAFGGGFTTQLASNWTLLVAHSGACRSDPQTGSWTAGTRFYVYMEVGGELVCKSSVSGQASSIWFYTTRGYVWSGGTLNARWNGTC